jgi:hypothetical protein
MRMLAPDSAKEVVMRRWISASMGVLLLAAFASVPVDLQAADKTVSGTVAAVSSDSITVKGKEAEMKLVVDSKTKIVGTGVGTKEAKLKEEKKSPQITDFLKAGDEVSAKYDDTSKHATEVRLVKAAAK